MYNNWLARMNKNTGKFKIFPKAPKFLKRN